MDLSELAARVDRLESRNAISEVIYRYAHCVRNGESQSLFELFADDATFTALKQAPDGGEPVQLVHYASRADLEKSYDQDGPRNTAPLVHNLIIEVNGDEAAAVCVMGGAALDGQPKFLGHYKDTLRRQDGVWRFTSRRYTVYGA